MMHLLRFGQGTFSEAEISIERELAYAMADNRQLKDTLLAIADAANGVDGAELIEMMALLALVKSAHPWEATCFSSSWSRLIRAAEHGCLS